MASVGAGPIVKECEGCTRTVEGKNGKLYCRAYPNPAYWWERKECPLATHIAHETKLPSGKKRAGQQHQKKNVKLSKKQVEAYARINAR